MQRHDRRFKHHWILEISYRGKADSANVTCSCGFVECVAVWHVGEESSIFTDAHGCRITFDRVCDIVRVYLGTVHPESEWFRWDMHKEQRQRYKATKRKQADELRQLKKRRRK